ncbi:DUF572 hypothetical protein, partial [Helicosporidium sp. ATCC 50920]
MLFSPRMNAFNNSHGALGSRARKLDEGILVIRFELPFNAWCAGCGHLMGKGVRFNAEKQEIGRYHSTRVWSFRMRTPCCSTALEVHTDPRNCEYLLVKGARRKHESYDAAQAGTLELPGAQERELLRSDALGSLESAARDA